MAYRRTLAFDVWMPDAFDPIAIILRLLGAFYVFAGLVAGRAALLSATLDIALAGLTMKPVSMRERALTLWLIASAWLVFASGVLLMVLAQEALWASIVCALTQAFYLTFAAPYYFDVEDPPDPQGRRQTTNAFFIYLGATLIVIWASGTYLTPASELHPVLNGIAWIALVLFALYMIWTSVSASRPLGGPLPWSGDDPVVEGDDPETSKRFDPSLMRLALSRSSGVSPVKNQKTGGDVDLATLDISGSLRAKLLDWMRDGDPDLLGLAFNLAEQLAHELPGVAVAEPGIPNAYFGYSIPSPYADLDTGAPNWDRMTAVKIMCDYGCYPVWAANDGVVGDLPPSALQISGALEDALLAWQARFDTFLNEDDPASPLGTPQDMLAHECEGLDLAKRVKSERPDLKVFVQSARGVLAADVYRPVDEWSAQDSALRG